LVRQPKTAVFSAEIEVRIYRTPALKVLIALLKTMAKIIPRLLPCLLWINNKDNEDLRKSALLMLLLSLDTKQIVYCSFTLYTT